MSGRSSAPRRAAAVTQPACQLKACAADVYATESRRVLANRSIRSGPTNVAKKNVAWAVTAASRDDRQSSGTAEVCPSRWLTAPSRRGVPRYADDPPFVVDPKPASETSHTPNNNVNATAPIMSGTRSAHEFVRRATTQAAAGTATGATNSPTTEVAAANMSRPDNHAPTIASGLRCRVTVSVWEFAVTVITPLRCPKCTPADPPRNGGTGWSGTGTYRRLPDHVEHCQHCDQ